MNNKKKIGIMTFHNPVNYGAILQAVALNKTLISLGADAEIIDYEYRSKKTRDSFVGKVKTRKPKKIIEHILVAYSKQIRRKKFQAFLNQNANVSEKKYDCKSIKEVENKYDAFVVGSDQIFDVARTGFDENFLLGYVSDAKKKYSYAASAGQTADELMDFLGIYLSDFAGISVRENVLQKKIQERVEVPVIRSIDPTFLMAGTEWRKLAKRPKETGYVLLYTLAKSPELLNAAKSIAKSQGKKLISISGRAEFHFGMKKISKASIEEFLGYFMCADYVVTNSFHGTAFSVIMERNFSVGFHNDSKMGNDRMATLLQVLGIEKCALQYENGTPVINDIDYNPVRACIKDEVSSAKKYLSSICESAD